MTFFLLDKKTRSVYFGKDTLQSNIEHGIYFEKDGDKIHEQLFQDKRFLYVDFNQTLQNKIQKFLLIFLGFLFLFCQIKFWSPVIPIKNTLKNGEFNRLEQENPYSESRILTLLNTLYQSKSSQKKKAQFSSLQTFEETHEFVRFPLFGVRGVNNFLFVTQSAIQKQFLDEKFYLLSNYSQIFTNQNRISSIQTCENNKKIYVFEVSNRNSQIFFIKQEAKTELESKTHISKKRINSIVLSPFNSKNLQTACEKFESIQDVEL